MLVSDIRAHYNAIQVGEPLIQQNFEEQLAALCLEYHRRHRSRRVYSAATERRMKMFSNLVQRRLGGGGGGLVVVGKRDADEDVTGGEKEEVAGSGHWEIAKYSRMG